MCHKLPCPKCFKPTWIGCGRHIDQALSDVPVPDRCACKAKTQEEHDSSGAGASFCSVQLNTSITFHRDYNNYNG